MSKDLSSEAICSVQSILAYNLLLLFLKTAWKRKSIKKVSKNCQSMDE